MSNGKTKTGLNNLNDDMLKEAEKLPDGHFLKEALKERHKEMENVIGLGDLLGEWAKFDNK